MNKKANIPWARVEARLAEIGREQQWLRETMDVSPSTLTNWKSRGVPSAKAVALAHAIGMTTDQLLSANAPPSPGPADANDRRAGADRRERYWLSGESSVEDAPAIVGALKRLPVVGRVQAGPDGMLSIDDYPPGHGDGYMFWYSTCTEAYALRIRGESMSPRYRPGEFVGVDPCADITPSDEVIAFLGNGQRMIKRLLWRRDDQVCFESVNQTFPNIILDMDEIDKMHLVIGNIPKSAFRSE